MSPTNTPKKRSALFYGGVAVAAIFGIGVIRAAFDDTPAAAVSTAAQKPVFNVPSLVGKPLAAVKKLAGGTFEAGSKPTKQMVAKLKKAGVSEQNIYETTDTFHQGHYDLSVTYNAKTGAIKDLFLADSGAVEDVAPLLAAGTLVDNNTMPYRVRPVKMAGEERYIGVKIITPELAAAEDAAAARLDKIKKQFSAYDGSSRPVERAIKAGMNDPDSYAHESTRYVDKGSFITVMTQFRGKNAFGALVLNTAVAKVDLDGNVLSLQLL